MSAKRILQQSCRLSVILLLLCCSVVASRVSAQPSISYITPDAAAPGMCVAVEFVCSTSGTLYVTYDNPADSIYLKIGPGIGSWDGRLLQTMLFVEPGVTGSHDVQLRVQFSSNLSAPVTFHIVQPNHVGSLFGGGVFGAGALGGRSARNTLVVDSLILQNGSYTYSPTDTDPTSAGNQGYLPLRVLSQGPIRLSNATISVSGSAGSTGAKGGNGGPGGGGGGSGYPGSGGDGFTGGGGMGESSSPGSTHGGAGSGSLTGTRYYDGGKSLNGANGGVGIEHTSTFSADEGGGGGTGHPFGTSGASGIGSAPSASGGYGAGSGGGSNGLTTNYAGGGAGYATAGTAGQGTGDNRGLVHGNEQVVPLAGGSGGGSGNVTRVTGAQGGCGGGGGGAIELTSFADFQFVSGSISTAGGNGTNGSAGLFESAAGGGAGSGGAIQLTSRDSITIGSSFASPILDVSGGSGGTGTSGNNGGNGGAGRVRLNGYVSKLTGNPNPVNIAGGGSSYAGPTIQTVHFTKNDFTVSGFAQFSSRASQQVDVIIQWPSQGTWKQVQLNGWPSVATTVNADPSSLTARWVTQPIPLSLLPADSEFYITAIQHESSTSGYTSVPAAVLSHTSGYIARPVRLPELSVSPLSIDFGLVRVGECKDSEITITNTGTAPLTIRSNSLGDSRFTLRTPLPSSLAPGQSLVVGFRFCPTDTVVLHSFDSLYSNALTSAVRIDLSGQGQLGILRVQPLLDFGFVKKGMCKDSVFRIYNDGNDTLTLVSETLPSSHFTYLSPSLPFKLPPYSYTTVTIRFCSTDTGAVESADTIHGMPESVQFVLLRATTPYGKLSLLDTVNFHSLDVGSCHDTSIVLSNVGTDTLVLRTFPNLPSQFTIVSALPIIIAPGQASVVTFRFCPTDTTEIVTTSHPDVTEGSFTNNITLLGKGVLGALTTSGPIDFGCVILGSTPHRTIYLSNTGSGSISSLVGSVGGDPRLSVSRQPRSDLAVGVQDSLVIRLDATSFGDVGGQVTLTWATGKTLSLPVTGHVSPAPAIDYLDTALYYDTTLVGDSSIEHCIRITNYSCLPINVSEFVLLGSDSSFSLSNISSEHSLVDSSTATLCFKFTPKRNGYQRDTLMFIVGSDSIRTAILSGYGRSPSIPVRLAADTVHARPGEIVRVPVRSIDDVTSAGITTVTMRVMFDPMQLDLNLTNLGTVAAPSTIRAVKKYSLGDQELTLEYAAPLVGKAELIDLPFEVLQPRSSTAPIKIHSASFGTSPAILDLASSGMIIIDQCDTSEQIAITSSFSVSQNNPNPFNPQTTITYEIREAGHMTIRIFDALGRERATAYDGALSPGRFALLVDGSPLESGSYRYVSEFRTASGMRRESRSMVLIK